MQITIVDYHPEWAIQFEQLKAVYQSQLGGLVDDIQHVGSTSVPGLAAKPVLDIDLIIETDNRLPMIIRRLEKLGYSFLGERGITGRYAFKQISALTPEDGNRKRWPHHHLYVCHRDSVALKNHISFRNVLRNNSGLSAQYSRLKRSLAANCPDSNQYVKGKTNFIVSVLQDMGIDHHSLQTILNDNLAD